MASHPNVRFKPLQNAITLILFVFFLTPRIAVASVNFDQCITDIRSGAFGPDGGTDNNGRPVPIGNATAITYELCIRACGTGPEPFQWTVFSQQFSSWLLPWLALISQLPFGSIDKLDNLTSMLLTIGSPTLAAYSLALTVLNGRWIARRFLPYTYPNARQAVQVLSSLQQSPIQINTDNSLLSSLIILPSNDAWWNTLVEALDYTHTWSISAATSIAWVIIAYIFTIADSFTGDVTAAVNANGQGVGSLWIWLLAIVSGWLLISPKCDSHRLHQAMTRANNIAYVATPCDGPVPTSSLSDEQAISLKQGVMDTLFYDESCTVPIYNYARFLSWVQAVEEVSDIFNAASERARRHSSVDPNIPWGKDTKYLAGIDHKNRIGTQSQVEAYCLIPGEHPMKTRAKGRTVWGPDVFSRILIASSVALFLQWGATGAAVVVVWLTPTKGFGCRSGAYLVYGAISTIVWMMLILSSFLSHYVRTTPDSDAKFSAWFARWLSIHLRRTGKIFAALNAVWIVVSCLFQFSNFFDRCYCNSSVMGLGRNAWDVIILSSQDVASMKGAWIGGVVLAAGCTTFFILFVNLFTNPPLPAARD